LHHPAIPVLTEVTSFSFLHFVPNSVVNIVYLHSAFYFAAELADSGISAGYNDELLAVLSEMKIDWNLADPKTILADQKMQAQLLVSSIVGTIESKFSNVHERVRELHPCDHEKYDLLKFNNGICALGVDNFLSAAAQFCEDEARDHEIDVISVGSGDGTIERAIIAAYRQRFGKNLCIKLIDPDPAYESIVDFKTVGHLIKQCPGVVGHCVVLIIWPLPDESNDNYDIDALRKLQPLAGLTIYESTGGSGSMDFRTFLHDDSLDDLLAEEYGTYNFQSQFLRLKRNDYGLDNYSIEELARQNTRLGEISGTLTFRMVKLKRIGPIRRIETTVTPATGILIE